MALFQDLIAELYLIIAEYCDHQDLLNFFNLCDKDSKSEGSKSGGSKSEGIKSGGIKSGGIKLEGIKLEGIKLEGSKLEDSKSKGIKLEGSKLGSGKLEHNSYNSAGLKVISEGIAYNFVKALANPKYIRKIKQDCINIITTPEPIKSYHTELVIPSPPEQSNTWKLISIPSIEELKLWDSIEKSKDKKSKGEDWLQFYLELILLFKDRMHIPHNPFPYSIHLLAEKNLAAELDKLPAPNNTQSELHKSKWCLVPYPARSSDWINSPYFGEKKCMLQSETVCNYKNGIDTLHNLFVEASLRVSYKMNDELLDECELGKYKIIDEALEKYKINIRGKDIDDKNNKDIKDYRIDGVDTKDYKINIGSKIGSVDDKDYKIGSVDDKDYKTSSVDSIFTLEEISILISTDSAIMNDRWFATVRGRCECFIYDSKSNQWISTLDYHTSDTNFYIDGDSQCDEITFPKEMVNDLVSRGIIPKNYNNIEKSLILRKMNNHPYSSDTFDFLNDATFLGDILFVIAYERLNLGVM